MAAVSLLTGVAAGVVTILGDIGQSAAQVAQTVNVEIAIYDDGKARIVCAVGAGMCALLGGLLFAEKDATYRKLISKVLSSAIASIVFTPIIVRWFGVRPTTDTLLACSGIAALVLPALIRVAVPVAIRIAGKKVEALEDPRKE